MHRHQTSSKYAVPKLKPHHHWLFKHKFQKPPLEILGSLVFCVALTLSEPTWSAPTVGDSTLAIAKIDPRESSVLTHPSIDSGTTQSATGELPQALTKPHVSVLDTDGTKGNTAEEEKDQLNCGTNQQTNLPLGGAATSPLSVSVNPMEALTLERRPEVTLPHRHSLVGEVGESPSGCENPENHLISSVSEQLAGVTVPQKRTYAQKQQDSPTSSNLLTDTQLHSVVVFDAQSVVGNSPRPSAPVSVSVPQVPSLIATEEEVQNSLPPESDPTPMENDSGSNQAASGDDPELGKLRLRELEETPPPSERSRSKPILSLLGRVGYLRSDNLFSGVDPVDDGLLRSGLTLLATPSLGPRTSLSAAVTGNLIRYGEESEFDYDELRLNLGLRQQLSSRAYGEVGWRNRNLFDEEDGDRFLNDHSFYLELGRRDTLAKQLSLDTFYQFRLSFADPDSRSQVTNSLGASLSYRLNPSLKAALDYQFALANFTKQEREDQYHQLIARLTYTLSSNSRLYVFGGHNFGNSSDPDIDFDGLVFGAGVDFNLTLF